MSELGTCPFLLGQVITKVILIMKIKLFSLTLN